MVDQLNAFASEVTPRGARGRHRRQARRPGAGARRRRHLEGPHRQRQLDGVEPDRPGPQHRRGDHRRRQRRPVARRSPSTCAARSCSSRKPSTRWSSSCARSPRKSRAWRARSAPKAGSACRRWCPAWPARGRTSPTRSTSMGANLTAQVRNIAEVTTAVARGDLSPQDHRRREGRDPRAEEHHQHDGRSAQRLRRRSHARGARSRHRRQARRPGAGARRRPAPGRTSPTTSTSWPPTSPTRSAAS